jgi:short-subunit dehydrogenase involved in D-alanine esterification of teichoic acids
VDIKLEVVVVPVFDVAKTATYTHVLVLGGSSGIGLETAWRAPAVVGPADVAALAVHLMTNTAVTGATYDIDGGQQLISG